MLLFGYDPPTWFYLTIGGFLSHRGTPGTIIHFERWDFPKCKPSSDKGVPPFMETTNELNKLVDSHCRFLIEVTINQSAYRLGAILPVRSPAKAMVLSWSIISDESPGNDSLS